MFILYMLLTRLIITIFKCVPSFDLFIYIVMNLKKNMRRKVEGPAVHVLVHFFLAAGQCGDSAQGAREYQVQGNQSIHIYQLKGH